MRPAPQLCALRLQPRRRKAHERALASPARWDLPRGLAAAGTTGPLGLQRRRKAASMAADSEMFEAAVAALHGGSAPDAVARAASWIRELSSRVEALSVARSAIGESARKAASLGQGRVASCRPHLPAPRPCTTP